MVAAGAAGAAGVAGAAAALAAAAALQMERCEGQSIFWQAGLQYATCLHPEQVFAGDSESQLAHFAGIPTGRDQNERPKRHHKVWVVWSRVEGCYAISTGMGQMPTPLRWLCVPHCHERAAKATNVSRGSDALICFVLQMVLEGCNPMHAATLAKTSTDMILYQLMHLQ